VRARPLGRHGSRRNTMALRISHFEQDLGAADGGTIFAYGNA